MNQAHFSLNITKHLRPFCPLMKGQWHLLYSKRGILIQWSSEHISCYREKHSCCFCIISSDVDVIRNYVRSSWSFWRWIRWEMICQRKNSFQFLEYRQYMYMVLLILFGWCSKDCKIWRRILQFTTHELQLVNCNIRCIYHDDVQFHPSVH